MQFDQWLDAERGRLAATALRFGVSMSAVSQWRANGVPLERMRDVVVFTRGEVTLEEMVPGFSSGLNRSSSTKAPA
jgi:DNA-binding transcriptional regulator YdaS (Cro superfamily)